MSGWLHCAGTDQGMRAQLGMHAGRNQCPETGKQRRMNGECECATGCKFRLHVLLIRFGAHLHGGVQRGVRVL
jgi:hypothetical protein